jgi:hypothetical protein
MVEIIGLLKGCILRNFRAYKRPENKTPTKLYLNLVEGYSGIEGSFLTVGVTVRTSKQRYSTKPSGKLIQEIFITQPTLNSLIRETDILNEISDKIGQPDAGHEAWHHTFEREHIAKEVFLKHTKDILIPQQKSLNATC